MGELDFAEECKAFGLVFERPSDEKYRDVLSKPIEPNALVSSWADAKESLLVLLCRLGCDATGSMGTASGAYNLVGWIAEGGLRVVQRLSFGERELVPAWYGLVLGWLATKLSGAFPSSCRSCSKLG